MCMEDDASSSSSRCSRGFQEALEEDFVGDGCVWRFNFSWRTGSNSYSLSSFSIFMDLLLVESITCIDLGRYSRMLDSLFSLSLERIEGTSVKVFSPPSSFPLFCGHSIPFSSTTNDSIQFYYGVGLVRSCVSLHSTPHNFQDLTITAARDQTWHGYLVQMICGKCFSLTKYGAKRSGELERVRDWHNMMRANTISIGHIGILCRLIKKIAWFLAVVQSLLIIASRKHYTVDVVVACISSLSLLPVSKKGRDARSYDENTTLLNGNGVDYGDRKQRTPVNGKILDDGDHLEASQNGS